MLQENVTKNKLIRPYKHQKLFYTFIYFDYF